MAFDITLLGAPRVKRDGEAVTFDSRLRSASRERGRSASARWASSAIALHVWPDHDLDRARGALRRTL